MSGRWYVLHGINPEPWKVGPISIGRRGERLFPIVGADSQLVAFQSAVREAITNAAEMIDGELELKFFFWRRRAQYSGAKKEVTKNEVDATNMQKATEDALQGLVMENDKLVRRVSSEIVEQDVDVTPLVVIYAEPWVAFDPSQIPTEIWERIDRAPTLIEEDDSNAWPPRPRPPVERDCSCIGNSHHPSCKMWITP